MNTENRTKENAFISIQNASKRFSVNGEELTVLEDVNLSFDSGEFITILGPSGCGKTTLLRCVGGFEKLTSGTILVNGKIVSKPDPSRFMVFQPFDQLFVWKTVLQNITYPLQLTNKGMKKPEIKQISMESLKMLGLDKFAHYYPHQLSGGMKQRVALARALSLKPSVILMDEPFASLDAQTRTALQAELLDLWNQTKSTVLFVTHNIGESIILGTQIVVMSGAPNNIKSQTKNTVPIRGKELRSPESPGFPACWKFLHEQL